MNVKTVLCYGDSNTYGLVPMVSPASNQRYPLGVRWTSILQQRLDQRYRIIEEGLSARTTVHDDPIEGLHKNGFNYLLPCLESHSPIDIVVIMLGTNDLKTRFSVTPADITNAIAKLMHTIETSGIGVKGKAPQIVLMAPVPIKEIGFLGEIFAGGAVKSELLADKYKQLAQEMGAIFINAGQFVECSPIDGVHFSAEYHVKLGNAVADVIQTIV